MELSLHDGTGTLQVADAVFDVPFNEPLIHQIVTAYQAGARAGTKAQKTRAMVSGGNSKPWRQKGTGRARAGSARSPIWRTGGRTFAAQPRSFEQKVNRKMYRGAMRSILSELVRKQRFKVLSAFALDSHKTGDLLVKLKTLQLQDVLIITADSDEKLSLAARNLHNVSVIPQYQLDPVSLIKFDDVLTTVDAVKKIEERLT